MVWSKTDDERKVSFYLYFWRVMVTVVDISDMSPQFVPAWKSLSTLITFILSSSSFLLWTLAQLEHLTIFFSPCIFFMCLFLVLFVIAIDLELTLHNVDSLSSLGDQWDCFQMRKERMGCCHPGWHVVTGKFRQPMNKRFREKGKCRDKIEVKYSYSVRFPEKWSLGLNSLKTFKVCRIYIGDPQL